MRSAREKVSSPGIADRLLFHVGRQLAATPLHEIEQQFGIAISESELRFGGVIGMACRFPSTWCCAPLGLSVRRRAWAARFVHGPRRSLAAAAITEGDLQRV